MVFWGDCSGRDTVPAAMMIVIHALAALDQ
jgi:hypothetical protein